VYELGALSKRFNTSISANFTTSQTPIIHKIEKKLQDYLEVIHLRVTFLLYHLYLVVILSFNNKKL